MANSRKISHSVISLSGEGEYSEQKTIYDPFRSNEPANGKTRGTGGGNSVGITNETYTDGPKTGLNMLVSKLMSIFTRKTLTRRIPITSWIRNYNKDDAVGDILAGITVGLTIIPQSLAYSNIAGVPPQYGLYSSFLGVFLYIFFGSCKDVPMGPTAIVSLLTFQTVNGLGIEHAILLCFLCGIIEFLMGICGLGFIIDFVSEPVSSGFTSAVALIIVGTQVKDLLGVRVEGHTFIDMITSMFANLQSVRKWDLFLGLFCITFLISLRFLVQISAKKLHNNNENESDSVAGHGVSLGIVVYKMLWFVGMFRNAILMLTCMALGYYFSETMPEPPFRLIGHIPAGLPSVQVPPLFGYYDASTDHYYGFFEMCSNLGSGLIVLPLLSIIENVAICKAFSNGQAIDVKQELIAIGICNVFNSFVQAFPGTGSIARSAVNNSSGVRTPFGGFYTSLIVIVALSFLTPFFYYIPKASLAAIIIAAVIFMVELNIILPMWRSKKSDLILCIATFLACLMFRLEVGILLGIGINLVFILHHAARPQIIIDKFISRSGIEYLIITPDRFIIFSSVDYVRNLVTKHSLKEPIPVVIDCTHIYTADFTAAKAMGSLTSDFQARDQAIFFYNMKPSVVSVFKGPFCSPNHFTVFYNMNDLDELLKHTIRTDVVTKF